MSSIDERVVKMEFDNKAFEKNAEDTISLLDKLKESLSFDKVKNSFSGITKAAKKVDVSGIDNSVQTVKASFSAMEIAGITAIANLTNSLMNFAKRTVGGLWSQIVQGGINRAFNIEKAKFTIEGLGKDWKKLEKDINYGVSGTAYGFDEAAMAASSMAASGVKAGDDMSHALLAISGMAAMTGSSFTDISNIFTTVAGNGRILSQQLNQFSSRGLNAAATLRDYINADDELRKRLIDKGLKSSMAKQVKEFQNATKLTEQNVRSLVSGSVIDFKTFSNAMHDAFGKQAKAANKTFNGVMSNIKATLSRIGEAFIHPLIANNDMDNMLKMVDTPLRKAIELTKETRRENKKTQEEYFNDLRKHKIFEKKTNEEIREEYKKNPKAFAEQVAKMDYSQKKWVKLMNLMSTSSKDIFVDTIRSNTKQFFDSLKQSKQFSGKTTKEIIADYKKSPKEFLKSVKEIEGYEKISRRHISDTIKYATSSDKTLRKMWDEYSHVQYNIVGVLQAVKRLFGVFETGIKNSKFLQTFQKTAAKACKALILLFNGLAATFGNVEKHGKKVLEVVGKKSHFVSAEKIWERFRKVLGLTTTEFENIKKAFKGVGDIFSAFVYVIKEVVKAFIPTKKEAKGFRSSILDVAGAIGEALSDFAEFIRQSSVITTIITVLKTAFSIFYKVISILLIPIKLLIKGVASLIKWFKKFKSPLKAVEGTFVSVFSVFKKLGSTFIKTGKKIINAFLKPFAKETKNSEKPGKSFSDVIDKIGNALKLFKEKVTGIGKWITDTINKFVDFDKITEIGQNVKNAIDNTIIPAFKNFGKFIQGKFTNIKLPNIGKMFSTVTGNAKTQDSIKNSMSQIKLPDFKSIFSNAFSTVGDAILNGLDKVRNFDYGAVFESVKEGFSNFIDFLGEVKDKVGEAFSKIGEGIKNNMPTFEEFANKLFEGFKKVVDNMSNILPEPNSFGVMLGDWIAAVISFIAKSIPYFVQILAAGFRTIISHLPQIVADLAKGIKEALNKGLFEPITVGTGEFKREIPPLFDVMSDTLKSLGSKFKDASLDDILGWLNKFLTAGVLNQLRKTLKSSAGLTDDIGKFFKKLGGAADDAVNGDNKGIVNKFSKIAAAIKDLAIAIGIIAGALVVLGHISEKSLKQGKDALLQLALGIAGFALALSLIQKFTGADLTGMLTGLASLVDGIKGLIVVLMAVSLVKDMSGPLGVLAAILIELGVFVFAVNKIGGGAATATAAMTALGGFIEALGSLVKMLVVLAVVPAKRIWNAIFELGAVMAELALLTFAISKIPVTGALKSIVNLIPIIAMLGVAIGALWLIKKFELDPKQLVWIAGSFGILGKTMAILAGIPILGAIKSVANMAIFVAGLVGILAVLGELNKNPDVRAFIEGGGELLHLIGKSIGKLVGGFAEGVMASAPAIADDLSAFAIHLLPFITTMKMMKGDVSENIRSITGAIKALVEANLGEAFSKFLGGGDLSSLAERFGEFITSFKKVMEGIPESGKGFDSKLKQIAQIAKVTETLAKVEKGLQSQGGLKAGVFGDKSFGKFISGVKKLFKGFVEIGSTAGEIKNIDTIKKVKDIAKALADTLAALPGEEKGKFWLDLAGGSKLSQFAKDLIKFGDSVSDYVSKFEGIDTSQMESVTKSVTKSIKSIAKSVSSKGNSKAFSNAGSNAMATMASGVSDNSKKLSTAFTSAISSALKNIKSDAFTKKGKELAKAFADAVSKYNAKSAGSSLVKSVTSGMGDTSGASTAGANVANGFINGIDTLLKKQAAYAAGKALGKKAIEGIKAGTDENSPSKAARKAGYHVDEGFVMGINRYKTRVYATGRDLGRDAINGLKESISGMQKLMNSNMNSPTIRPVLDLSNVKMGLNSLDSMMNNSYALGIAGTMPTSNVSSASKNITFNNRITVDGTSDPAEWADEFMQELEIQARTL